MGPNYTRFAPLNQNHPKNYIKVKIDLGFDIEDLLLRKLLRENNSELSIRTHRCGFGNRVSTRIEVGADLTR